MERNFDIKLRDWVVGIFNRMLRARASREDTFAKFSLLLVAHAAGHAYSDLAHSISKASAEASVMPLLEKLGLQEGKAKVLHWLGENESHHAWAELQNLPLDVNILDLHESILPTCLGVDSECLRVNADVARAMVDMVMPEPYGKIGNISCGAGQVIASAVEAGVPYVSLCGAEQNFSALLIARIRMMLRGLDPAQIYATTALTNDMVFQTGCCDVVFATPSSGGWHKTPPIDVSSLSSNIPYDVLEECPYAYLLRGLSLLKPGGRLAIVLPMGFLVERRLQELRQFILNESDVLAIVTIRGRLRASAGCLVILKRKSSAEQSRCKTFLAKSPRAILDLASSGRIRKNPYREIVGRFLADDRTVDQVSRRVVLPENGSWTPNAFEADEWYRQNLTYSLFIQAHRDMRIRDVLKLYNRPRDLSGIEFPRYVENTVHGIVERASPPRNRQLDFLIHAGRVLERGMLLVSLQHGRLIANLVTNAFEGMFLSDHDQSYTCTNIDDRYSAMVRLTFISLLLRSNKYAHYIRARIIQNGWQEDFLDYLIPSISFGEMKRYYDLNEDVAQQTSYLLNEQASCISRVTAAYDKFLGWDGGRLSSSPVMPLEELWVKQPHGGSGQRWNGPILRNISVNNNFLDYRYLEGLLVTKRVAKPVKDVIRSRVPWGYLRQFIGRVLIPVPAMDVQQQIIMATQDDVKTIRDGLVRLQELERHHPVAARIDEEVFG